MRRKTTSLYILLWLIYGVFFFFSYPLWGLSSAIPFFVLIGVGAWLYGTRIALSIYCLCLVYHAYVLSIYYGNIFDTYQTKLSSTLVIIALSYLVGNLRRNFDAIKELNQKLEQRVEARNTQLSLLTAQLLNDSENLKTAHAEGLHDGIGQQLTGIQLLSTSLYDHLLTEGNSAVALADHLQKKTSKTHYHIRKISRLLFPVRIEQVGLMAALSELSATIQDLKKVNVHFVEAEKTLQISDNISLQLYRICQEYALFAIDHLSATELTIRLSANKKSYCVHLAHNGTRPTDSKLAEREQLLKYRLQQIEAKMETNHDFSGKSVTKVRCHRRPSDQREAAL